jgi:hypothetical protein
MNETNTQLNGVSVPTELRFEAYDPKSPVEKAGLRSSKLLYKKNPQTGVAAGVNSCVFLPAIAANELEAKLAELSDYLCGYLETVQDRMIRELHATGVETFQPEQVSIDSIISYLASTGTTNRLNAETIHAWFDDELHDSLVVAFAAKQQLDIDTITESDLARIEIVVGAYKHKFGMLASGKTKLNEQDTLALQKALEVTETSDTPLGQRFTNRLANMQSKEVDLLASL